jgi:hypothetical protein
MTAALEPKCRNTTTAAAMGTQKKPGKRRCLERDIGDAGGAKEQCGEMRDESRTRIVVLPQEEETMLSVLQDSGAPSARRWTRPHQQRSGSCRGARP